MSFKDQSVVVMPAANRPEMAALALEMLGRADDCPPVHLFVDDVDEKRQREFEDVWRCVVGHFANDGELSLHFRSPHIPVSSGCYNILNSILDGYNTGAKWVFLVEEDVLVNRDFFTRHQSVMEGGAIASCGRFCRLFGPRYPDIYTNPGSCLSRRFLDALVPHINDRFFANTGAYMDALQVPPVPGIHGLDDGLIRRVMWLNGWQVVQPPIDKPLCAHIGCMAIENKFDFVGFNSDAPVLDRAEQIRNFLKTIDRLGPKSMYLRDLDPFPPEQL